MLFSMWGWEESIQERTVGKFATSDGIAHRLAV